MHKTLVPVFALALVSACTDPPPPTVAMPIELRNPSAAPVAGTSFECTGTWPSDMMPCAYPWSSQPWASASSPDADTIAIGLGRRPIPVDGGASTVEIDLRFFGAGVERHLHAATANSYTTRPGLVGLPKITDAISGWIEPIVVGDTPDQRNSGRFWLDFGWGTLRGTYDTADPPL